MVSGPHYLSVKAAPLLRMLGVLLALLWQAHVLPTPPLFIPGISATAAERVLAGDIKTAARVIPGEMRAQPAPSDSALGSSVAVKPEAPQVALTAHVAAIMPCEAATSRSGEIRAFLARAPPSIA